MNRRNRGRLSSVVLMIGGILTLLMAGGAIVVVKQHNGIASAWNRLTGDGEHADHDHANLEHSDHDHSGPGHEDHGHGTDAHEGHAHDEQAHDAHESGEHRSSASDEDQSLVLSKQALGNLGLTDEFIQPIQVKTFERMISIPAIVVERPGRTRLEVATPMAGVVTHVHAVQGEAIAPGSLLFELRITAEELVTTQTEMLKTLGELDVEKKEIARIAEISQAGAIAQKTLIEREYAKEKLEALLAAQREALRLQGLTEKQISDIENERRLLRDLRIYAPSPDEHRHDEFELTQNDVQPASFSDDHESHAVNVSPDVMLVIQELRAHKGEIVTAGATLGVVSDLSELLIEGKAFEQDASFLADAAAGSWKVSALVERAGKPAEVIPDLQLLYSSNEVDVESRTLRFYVRLPNQVVRSSPSPNGQRYLDWKYRLGQRMQLRVPVEVWENQMVVPVDAIAQDGPENYLFQRNGKKFQRVPVTVVYRDQLHAVIKNDGSIFPGDQVALRGAHQMQMALKNKSGGGVDPHAGHSH